MNLKLLLLAAKVLLSADLVVTDHVVLDAPVRYTTITVEKEGFLEILPGAEITFEDAPINTETDPEQLGHGLLCYGKLRIKGTPKTPYARLRQEILAGDQWIGIDAPKDWRPGDVLYIPDTRQPDHPFNPAGKPLQEEFRTIRQVQQGGIFLTEPLAYSHMAARDADGRIVFMPTVANMTRDILLKSENPDGVRAHCYFNARADIEVEYAAFRNMGRTTNKPLDSTVLDAKGKPIKIGTNQIGRYPVHFHHLHGPEVGVRKDYQFFCRGNVVWSDQPINRWGIDVHHSHFGLIEENVVVCCAGGGIVTEDGNETANIFRRNYVAHVTGESRPDARSNEIGHEGGAYWFRGPNNRVEENHAYSAQFGYTYYPRFASTNFKYPTVPGGMETEKNEPCKIAIPSFKKNEAVSCQAAFSPWWIGAIDRTPVETIGESVIDDLTSWHCRGAVSAYECGRFVYRNLVAIGDKRLSGDSNGGWGCSDYVQWRCRIEGGRIENYRTGIRTPAIADSLWKTGTNPGLFVVRGTTVKCQYNLAIPVPWHNANANGLPPVTLHLDYPRLLPLSKDTRHIAYITSPAEFCNYAQWLSVNYHQGPVYLRWFGPQQFPDAILPATALGGRIQGAPTALPNKDAWKVYGLASGGEVAPPGIVSLGNDGRCVFTVEAPVIRPIPEITLQPGQVWSYGVCAYDPSLGELVYSVQGPKGMAIENRSGKLNWTASHDEGVFPVTITATDEDEPHKRGKWTFLVNVRHPTG